MLSQFAFYIVIKVVDGLHGFHLLKLYLESKDLLNDYHEVDKVEAINIQVVLEYGVALYLVLVNLEFVNKELIRIAANNEFNASTFPDGYILINTGLFSKLTYNELLAVCAHELVHYMFNHSLANEYAYIKKQKSNKLWAEIGGGLLMGASAFADGYSAGLTGQQTNNSEYYASMYQGIIN